jgi:hypothetical protein
MKGIVLLWIVAILALTWGCAAGGKSATSPRVAKPQYDKALGQSEKSILAKYGAPKEVLLKPANALSGELRSGLRSKVSNEDVEVKELYYKTSKGERIFWLAKQNGEWKVISDVEVPEGTLF